MCEQWYHACKEDFIDPYVNAAENLPFCKRDSLICSLVSDVSHNDAATFCRYLGFKVQTNQAIEEEGKQCFDGIPSSQKKGPLKPIKDKSSSIFD